MNTSSADKPEKIDLRTAVFTRAFRRHGGPCELYTRIERNALSEIFTYLSHDGSETRSVNYPCDDDRRLRRLVFRDGFYSLPSPLPSVSEHSEHWHWPGTNIRKKSYDRDILKKKYVLHNSNAESRWIISSSFFVVVGNRVHDTQNPILRGDLFYNDSETKSRSIFFVHLERYLCYRYLPDDVLCSSHNTRRPKDKSKHVEKNKNLYPHNNGREPDARSIITHIWLVGYVRSVRCRRFGRSAKCGVSATDVWSRRTKILSPAAARVL